MSLTNKDHQDLDIALEEIFNNLYIWDNSADGAIKIENSLNNAKQQILALKSKWETEARIDEIKNHDKNLEYGHWAERANMKDRIRDLTKQLTNGDK
jgi:hypothetical protein